MARNSSFSCYFYASVFAASRATALPENGVVAQSTFFEMEFSFSVHGRFGAIAFLYFFCFYGSHVACPIYFARCMVKK